MSKHRPCVARLGVAVAMFAIAGCGGSTAPASESISTGVDVTTPSSTGPDFEQNEPVIEGGSDATTASSDGTPPASDTPSTTQPSDSDASTTTKPATSSATTTSANATVTTEARDATSATASTRPASTNPAATDVASTNGTAASRALAAVITPAEIEAAGLGTNWDQEIEVQDDGGDPAGEEDCRLDEIDSPGSVYADNSSAEGFEFEQLIGPGNGKVGVQIFSELLTCDSFTSQAEMTFTAADIDVEGATSSFAFSADDDGVILHWYSANFDGDLIAIFHVSGQGDVGERLIALLELAASRL